jgi:hypothetical protein
LRGNFLPSHEPGRAELLLGPNIRAAQQHRFTNKRLMGTKHSGFGGNAALHEPARGRSAPAAFDGWQRVGQSPGSGDRHAAADGDRPRTVIARFMVPMRAKNFGVDASHEPRYRVEFRPTQFESNSRAISLPFDPAAGGMPGGHDVGARLLGGTSARRGVLAQFGQSGLEIRNPH